MKKILLFVLVGSFMCASKLKAQCTVYGVGFQITNSQSVDATHCSITFNLSFKINNNNGNKIVVLQAWMDSDYPNYWNCNSSNQQQGNKKAPTASDLKKNGTGPLPFINLAFNNDVNPPVAIASYGPDNTVPIITGYTVTRGAPDANGDVLMSLIGVTAIVPAPCGTGVSVRADAWSSQSSINSSWVPQCVNCNNLFAFNYPQVSADILCGTPNRYHVHIANINTNQTIVISGWQAFFDYTPAGAYGAEDSVLADDRSSSMHVLAPGAAFDTTISYSASKSDAKKNLWILVSTQGLANTQRALASNSCGSLPVHLSFFNAKRTNSSNVSLTWQTSQEINSKGFEIQRLIGTGGWQTVGFVASQGLYGNSSAPLNYSFNDNNNAHAITQYRLKEIDIDANSKFSEIRAVRGDGQAGKIIVYPNPSFDGTARVVFEEINGTRDVSLNDASGRVIKQWNGVTNNNLTIDNLTPGFYSLRVVIRETGEQSIEKIIVNKR